MAKKKVIGIGGIFFKSQKREELNDWYRVHLGIESESWGAVFPWKRVDTNEETYTAWSTFKHDTKYLAPSSKDFMINYQVLDLAELLIDLEKEGVSILPEREESEFGKFAWLMDPEGNKIELWEPPKK